MTQEEWIARAREHAATFERGVPFPARVADFEKARVREAVLICFCSDSRDDYIEVMLDRETGEFIAANYSPPATGNGTALA